MKLSHVLPFTLSIACALAVAALVAAPAAAQLGCFVCDNNQCRELTKHTEQEIGFPDCIDGQGPSGPFCFTMGLPCADPGLQTADLPALDEPLMSPLSATPPCAVKQTPSDLPRQTAELL